MSLETVENGPNHVFGIGNTGVLQNTVAYCPVSGISPQNLAGFRWANPAIVFTLVLICFPGRAFAQCEPWLARLVSAQGQVELQGPQESGWRPAQLNQYFCLGDKVRTLDRSRASLQLANDSYLSLDQTTTIVFSQSAEQLPSWLDLLKGVIYLRSRTPRAFGIRTPFVNAAIKGTEFAVRATDDTGSIDVYEGVVEASNRQGTLNVHSGETVAAAAGKAPQPALHLKPTDAVAWALYYPPIIDYITLARKTKDPLVRKALTAYSSGQVRDALVILDAVPEIERNPSYLSLKAGLFLTLGRSDEAEPLIATLLATQPEDATALALRSVVALAKNDKATALALAERAVAAERSNPIPLIARSYAEQADFKLERALQSVDGALSLSPENGLAHARRAELLASLGRTPEALASAEKAKRLNPGFARSYTVLGFIHLMEIDLEEAKGNFQEAIFIDSADPLARFGLGLAKIRQGELEAGTEEIEIAASLDPTDSLTRSYLGKAYYEQKREKLAETEYELAKQFDPKDPTPWFYEAIKKQTENRPVDALHDMQKAIELNDNRAVYRSRQALDNDLAARSAAVGRIYQDLNFQQRGLLEGWRSVIQAPTDYSGHRLLADTYAKLPGQQIARVSELMQSQLLQPLNVTPVQPSLGTRNLLILDQSGPSLPSFREFNPAFQRNRFSLQAYGLVGSLDSYGDEVIHSGVYDRLSYSLGQYHFQSRGYRPNNDLQQNIYNAFIQAQVTPEIGIQTELRYTESSFGALLQRFDLSAFDRNARNANRLSTARLGGTFHFTPNQTLLANFIYGRSNNDRDRRTEEPPIRADSSAESDQDALSVELEYLGRWDYFDSIIGVGYYAEDRKDRFHSTTTFDFPPAPLVDKTIESARQEIQHANAYIYNHIRLPYSITGIIGLSVDSFNEQTYDRQQVNPKFGIVWDLTRDTTLRAAWFSVLKRPFVLDQTVEPTQVAGFNQFFDDINGSKSTRYGFGLDHRFSRTIYSGFEFSWRQISTPYIEESKEEDKIVINKSSEQLHRAYLYWTPTSDLSFSAEYFLQKWNQDNDNTNVDFFDNLTTHTIPASVSYFFDNGLFARTTASFVRQIMQESIDKDRVSDSFVLLDLSMGYRFPKRLGIFSFSVRNVLDERFNYFDVYSTRQDLPSVSPLIPERTFWAQLLINF
jgi:tetratricopeptide (TPR) repeat protein